MKSVLIAAVVGLVVAVALTPYLIKLFSRPGFGQEIREEVAHHAAKRGTPTMGGIAIVVAMWVGYLVSVLVRAVSDRDGGPTASAWLLLGLSTGVGAVGFLDDFLKIRHRRNLGLRQRAKLIGQTLVAVAFGVGALLFRNADDLTPGSTRLSFTRDLGIAFGAVGFVLVAVLVIAAWTNAVNFTDGLDGLAASVSVMVLGSYVAICFFQFRNACWSDTLSAAAAPGCYTVRDPLDLAVVAAAALGGCLGFLWWNAHPAKIIMGDTGALALGGLVAGLAVLSRTELLMVVIGGLFVIQMLADVVQIIGYRTRRVRIFRMAPFHHHFELGGWAETTIYVRFLLLAAISAALGVGIFYAEWLSLTGG